MRPRLSPYGLLLITLLLVAGCSASVASTPTSTPPKAINIFIVPDLSGSAFAMSKGRGEHVVREALAKAAPIDGRPGGRVTIVALTDDTVGQTNIALSTDFTDPPAWVEPSNDQSVTIWVNNLTASVMDTYRKWRAKQHPTPGSDYLGMLLVAGRLLASPTTAQQELWIVGDGIEATRQWDMYRHHPTATECKTEATAMKRTGTLGQLHGGEVYFIGGGLNPAALFTPAEQAQLTACWAEIIHTAGGQTPADWWNPSRLMAPEAP